ncbi:MAG: hypothetical protein RLZZ142_1833 [Verrucomicrobiota bacterium]|jgi:hypothetical protein
MSKPDPLEALLAQWSEPSDPPEGFRREVWARIAQRASPVSGWERLTWWILQPQYGVWLALLIVGMGFVYGLLRPPAPVLSPRDAYVLSISPFALEGHLETHR